MKITEILKQKKPTFSFEFFPPKTPEASCDLWGTFEQMKKLTPGFISITYGAGGSTREKTLAWVREAKERFGFSVMAHLTCVGHSKDEIRTILDRLAEAGIENIMALRGDPPRGATQFEPHPQGFQYASDLVQFIRQERYPFCLAVAGYPEGHTEAPSRKSDWANLVHKIKSGADAVITQLFFDTVPFFELQEELRRQKITVPVIPGIMPVTNFSQTVRFTQMCGAAIPPQLLAQLQERAEDSAAIVDCGIAHALEECRILLAGGVTAIHFYTLNRSHSTQVIVETLQREGLL